MAFKHGKGTAVYYNAKDLSAYFQSADLDADVDTGDTTTFQATWKTALAGQAGVKWSAQGLYDPLVTDLVGSIGVDFGTPVLTFCPAGAAAIGDRARLMSVATTGYAESSPVGGIVGIKWSVLASGPVGFGDILHTNTVDSGTTTGATKDDTAATSLGWVAHLHVIAVSSGSWVVKIQDASASNFSDGADVAGLSFTAATAATQQRLISATAITTMRRYVRYVATVTGGSSPTITFVLAYARNN